MDFDEIMDKHAASMSATPDGEPAESAQGTPEEPVAADPAAQATATPDQETKDQNADPTPPIPDPTPSEPVAAVDYGKFLEESSEGLFKSVDDLKASLVKVKEFDELKQKLEAKENENPFANDYVKKLNDLYRSGKTEDQISVFNSLNKLGDIDNLDPFEAKVQNLMYKGYPRASAERKVTREFGLDLEINEDIMSEDEVEKAKLKLEDAKEDLRISALDDKKELKELLVSVESSDSAQTKILQDAAAKQAYEKKLQPFVDELAAKYVSNIDITAKVDDKDIKYSFAIDDDARMDIAKMAKDFFLDNPVNEQNVADFNQFAKATIVARNLETKIVPEAIKYGVSLGKKQAIEEYENKSGLVVTTPVAEAQSADALIREQQRKAAFGED